MKCRNTCTLPRADICHLVIAFKALHHLQVLTDSDYLNILPIMTSHSLLYHRKIF